jgi:3-deoxy-D-manno-octulosonic-acid transferase
MENIYLALYNSILLFLLMIAFPFVWRRIKPDKEFPGDWKERFGVYNREVCVRMKQSKNVWIHTVSIGEFLSVNPLIKELQKENNVVVTLATKTGRGVAEEKFPDTTHLFFPADFYPIMMKAVNRINPKLIIIVETEIWPSLLKIAYDKKIPVALINGRISPSSYPKYKKMRFFVGKFLRLFSVITMRNHEEAGRIMDMGALKEKIKVVGSMKFDLAYDMSKQIDPSKIREQYKISSNKKVAVFGSLHPAEEEGVVEVVAKLLNRFKDILIIIVPRYLDKTDIYKILSNKKIKYMRKSSFVAGEEFSVLIVDTYGELNNFYSICDMAFVGASLNPWGGQNPIEPISFKKPVVYGKYNWHFLEEWRLIKEGGGGIEVDSFVSLYDQLVKLIENPSLASEIGEKGYNTLLENMGATERNLKVLSRFL